uniref:Uncharacterized protein n=1 Tax=Gibberella zeae TaxID=5518 RepID=A0A4E9DCF7_GIBZA
MSLVSRRKCIERPQKQPGGRGPGRRIAMRLKSTQQLAQRCRKFEDGEVVQESGRPRIRGEANSNRIVFAEYACGSGAAGLEDGER